MTKQYRSQKLFLNPSHRIKQAPTTNMLTEGTVLNGTYKIDSHIPSGAFGNCYMATHLKLNKDRMVEKGRRIRK